MNTNIFLPKKINVGFQRRTDTYTKSLAYIIYYDEKNVLRKETSWQSWRDKEITPKEFDNEPTSGFVLNKKVGGYKSDWNFRQAYVRVYDPRGFEFEITVPNLIYILENCSSIKGKGLEGEFVYGWEGKDLLLIPVDAPDYAKYKKYTDAIFSPKKIGKKDLVLGGTYQLTTGKSVVYMGQFPVYHRYGELEGSKNGIAHYFAKAQQGQWYQKERRLDYSTSKSVPKIAQCLSDQCVANYAEMMDFLKNSPEFEPAVKYEIKTQPMTLDEFRSLVRMNSYRCYFFTVNLKEHNLRRGYPEGTMYDGDDYLSTEAVFEKYHPVTIIKNKIGEKKNECARQA